MALPHPQKRSPAEGELLFQLDPEPLEECVTAYAGIPLFVQAMRSLNVPGSVRRCLQIKQRQRGLDEASYVESFLVLNALGGECLDDFDRLGEDQGLAEMLGHEMPSPEAARHFLYAFHSEEKLQKAAGIGGGTGVLYPRGECPTASFGAGESGTGAGGGQAMCGSEDCHD
jgi:hypothetical protein